MHYQYNISCLVSSTHYKMSPTKYDMLSKLGRMQFTKPWAEALEKTAVLQRAEGEKSTNRKEIAF